MADFDKKKAEEQIKNIKNNIINPYRDAMKKGSKVNSVNKQVISEKASKGYDKALEIEQKAEKAGVTLDKNAARRLEKIKTRYAQATGKDTTEKAKSDKQHIDNQREARDFKSGKKAAMKKERWER